jgi:hypothetical protein
MKMEAVMFLQNIYIQPEATTTQATTIYMNKRPATRHGGALGERRYSYYSYTTSALDGYLMKTFYLTN